MSRGIWESMRQRDNVKESEERGQGGKWSPDQRVLQAAQAYASALVGAAASSTK
jgi:hypothetical protein